MLRTDEILSTIQMLHAEHLDVRTVTLALNVDDCAATSMDQVCRKLREKVLSRAKVRAEEGRATNFATATGVLFGPGDARKTLALALVPGAVGVYETELEPLDPGTYKVLVEARKDNQSLGKEEVQFTVGRPNQEFERLSIDRALLKKIAEATGASYYEPAAFGDLVDRLRTLTIKEDIRREFGIQTVPGLLAILFGLFLALVTGEWLLRTHYQLN